MALVDGAYSAEESEMLKILIQGMNLSDKSRTILFSEIEKPKQKKVDLSVFKDDMMSSTTLMAVLTQLAKADGTLHPAEKLYLQSLGHELGYADEDLKLLTE